MKRVVILLSLIIFLSGCTMPWESGEEPVTTGITQSPTEGVIIESFGVKDPLLIGGAETKISMIVRNVGGALATNIELEPPSVEDLKHSKEYCLDLNPPFPNKKELGDTCTKEWDFEAPIYSKKVVYSREGFLGRVTYDYSTNAKVTIPIYTSDRLNVLKREGKEPKGTPPTKNSYAPIHLDYAGPAYLEAETYDNGRTKTYELTINFRNVGEGKIESDDYNSRQYLKTINFEYPSELENYISIYKGNCEGEKLKLNRYEGNCNFEIKIEDADKIKELPNKELILNLKIIADYTYIEEKSSTLTINPR